MCLSNDAIEHQAYQISEMIQKDSIYKFINVNGVEGNSLGLPELAGDKTGSGMPIITKIVLQDEEGTNYTIRPTLTGLRFAKGELTYKEYTHIERMENIRLFALFVLVIPVFFLAGWLLIKLLA